MNETGLTTLMLVTPPAAEALAIDEIKRQCGLESDDHNELLEGLIAAATEYAQEYTARSFITQTWDLWLDAFPSGTFISVPRPPLLEVIWVKYLDAAGTLTEWDSANYRVALPAYANAQDGRIVRASTVPWPVPQVGPHSVNVRYTAGYGATGEYVPMVIRTAMKQFIAEAWSVRGNTIMGSFGEQHQTTDRLLQMYRSSWL
jgi:uncharacterized phiE125 gp8 family phage protein